jgi:hypothetical protein
MTHPITSDTIRRAADQLAQARPLDADRLRAACNLLLRGGYTVTRGGIQWHDGTTATTHGCSCAENRFVLCLHQLAAQVAAAAAEDTDVDDVPLPLRLAGHCIGAIGGARFWRYRPVRVVAA